MRVMQLGRAKASLAAVVEAAERGEATTITKHGKPAAIVVPVKDARRLYPTDKPGFAALLKGIPCTLEMQRDPSPFRVPDL